MDVHTFGNSTDKPVPGDFTGDYDGSGITDATVFRPSNVTRYSTNQTQGTLINGFGAGTDRPTPNAYVP